MDWIQQWQSKLNKQNGVAPLVQTGGSRHTGLAALPYRNIHRTFCIGKKNWMFHNTAKGAGASALVYSISETAKLNNLRPYYFRHILTELPKYRDKKGNIDPAKLDHLMPWAEELPEECRKPRRS